MWSINWFVAMSTFYLIRGRLPADWPLLVLGGFALGLVMALGTWVVNVNESKYEKMKYFQSKRSL
jgi:hypothetical protein